MNRPMRGERGFTLVETLAVTTIISVLSLLSIMNYTSFKQQVHNTVALSDYRNIKGATYAEDVDSDTGFYLAINLLGPVELSPPLEGIRLSNEVRLHWLYRIQLVGIDLRYIRVSHEKGSYYYQFLELNGVRSEQVIAK